MARTEVVRDTACGAPSHAPVRLILCSELLFRDLLAVGLLQNEPSRASCSPRMPDTSAQRLAYIMT